MTIDLFIDLLIIVSDSTWLKISLQVSFHEFVYKSKKHLESKANFILPEITNYNSRNLIYRLSGVYMAQMWHLLTNCYNDVIIHGNMVFIWHKCGISFI